MPASGNLGIGALAERAGCNVPTIRYYETIGLLPRAARREGGYRTYDETDVDRLIFIRRCRDFGFSIDDVRRLLALAENPSRNCDEARDQTQAHLDAIRTKLDELKALERNLARLVADCTMACLGGPTRDCLIFQEIKQPKPLPSTAKGSGCC